MVGDLSMAKAENKIQLEIIKWLKAHDVFCWRNNGMGVFDPKIGTYRSNPYSMRGVGDIIGVLPDGRFLSCEVKTPKGKPSADQVLFIKRCSRLNGVCFVARSIKDTEKALRDAGLDL
jgi:hypothetical protein